MAKKLIPLLLPEASVELLKNAIDSHRYWQLSDEKYRNSGFVMDPGSDDQENRRQLRRCDDLEAVLEAAVNEKPDAKAESMKALGKIRRLLKEVVRSYDPEVIAYKNAEKALDLLDAVEGA